jgi:O-antigen ligase
MKRSTDISSTVDRLLFYCFCGLFLLFPIGTSPIVIVGIITICLWIFSGKFVRDRHRWLGSKWALPVFFAIVLPWAGLLYTPDMAGGLDFSKKTYYWLLAFAVASTPLSERSIKTFLGLFIAGLTVVSVSSVLQFAGVVPMADGIPTIQPPKHITNALLLVIGMLVLSFGFPRAESKARKGLIVLLMALFFVTLSLGVSRAGYLAFVLMSPLMIYNLVGQKRLLKVAAIAVLITGAMFLSPSVQDRISKAAEDVTMYGEGNKLTSIGARFLMWKGAIDIFLDNPVWGAGTGGYKAVLREQKTVPDAPDFDDPHNSFLYMAANFGIIGLICILWLFGALLKSGWQSRQSTTGFSILAFTLVLLVGSLTGTQILSTATGMLFALSAGLQEHLDMAREESGNT